MEFDRKKYRLSGGYLTTLKNRVDTKRVQIDGKKFWADICMIPLLKAMNKVGLKTQFHCSGHENGRAYLSLAKDNIEEITVKEDRIIIRWNRK